MVWIALSIGLMSGFHCVGMCGPIALAVPVIKSSLLSETMSRLLYHAGRIISYIMIGFTFGLIGSLVSLGGFQQIVSISAGVFLLLFVLPSLRIEKKLSGWGLSFFKKLKQPAKHLIVKRNYGAIFVLGVINGIIPCGMVYVAASGALASGSLVSSMMFMFFFGVGTMPVLYALASGVHLLSIPFRKRIRQFIPVWIGVLALIFILRGLNLDIPYLSPRITEPTAQEHCH
ncbi:MAG: sulfite exporter TauE/SafE family protein [Candidatus Competibacteraceae bacterium]|nr:sulfite exporter TauE/SafE family protein [Candidatus Competibacteraceae bacterium]